MRWRSYLSLATAVLLSACQAPTAPAPSSAKNDEASGKTAEVRLATDAAVRDAYLEATGSALDDQACIARPSTFDAVVVVGRAIAGPPCVLTGVFVHGHWLVGDVAVMQALASRGWSDATGPMRRQLALDWTREVMYAFGPAILEDAPPTFTGPTAPKFSAPYVESGEHESTIVTLWVQEAPTASGAPRYGRQRLTFADDGTVTTQRIERFVASEPAPAPASGAPSGGDELGAGTAR